MPDQYYNQVNIQAHYATTGPDIWQQSGGQVTHVVMAMGTCGTIGGVAKYLKQQNPGIQIWGVDAYNSARSIDARKNDLNNSNNLHKPPKTAGYQVEGIGVDVLDGLYSPNQIDLISSYSDADIFAMAKKYSSQHGLLIGLSSAAVLSMLHDNLDKFKPGDFVVAILADSGRSYLEKMAI